MAFQLDGREVIAWIREAPSATHLRFNDRAVDISKLDIPNIDFCVTPYKNALYIPCPCGMVLYRNEHWAKILHDLL